MIFTGYEKGVKGYRAYDSISKIVHFTREVVFEEEKSWNWGISNQS